MIKKMNQHNNHHNICCTIIPNYILDKIDDNESIEKSRTIVNSHLMRSKRNFLLKKPQLKKISRSKKTHKEVRRLFDSKNNWQITSKPIQIDEQIHSTEESKYMALELANKAYDFFHDNFKLESYDGKNALIDTHINYGKDYNNAFWDGDQMVFGNGDKYYFNPFLTQNIFTHEITHAITEFQCGLKYESESGALNEHFSDVFAVCLDQKIKKQTPSTASWVIGEGLLTPRVKNAKGLRTFKDELAYDDPKSIGTDPQPKNMKSYQNLPNDRDGDYGGVHINSGIVNHAFYLFCLAVENKIATTSAYKEPALIWFKTYKKLKPNSDFIEFSKATVSTARYIYPSLVSDLQKAWQSVGL